LQDGGTWKTIAGQPTDDSELALDLARTLVAQASWSSEAVATAYAGWYASHPFDIGSTTRQALSAAARAKEDKARAAQTAASRESQSNGALMRCSPIGIWAHDAAEAAVAGREDAALTHPHPICKAASAAFVAAIFTAISGGDRAMMLAAAEAAIPEAAAEPLREALAGAQRGEGPPDFMRQQGWVLIGFQNAFRHLALETPLEDAVIRTVGAGGDTDTNAAICGALLGAAQGRAGVPLRWRTKILACRPLAETGARQPRPARYWPDDLPVLAEALLRRRMKASSSVALNCRL
jgi:ADP-ribosylglycohydrolase